jgi:hypothetical protein
MQLVALVLFALAAVGGLVLAVRHFRGQPLPAPLAVIHGLAAATGLVLVLLAYLAAPPGSNVLGLALLLLVVAALGGFFLVSFHLRGRRAPSPAVVIHALVAVAGVVTLLVTIL